MSELRVFGQPAFVLQQRSYRESSLLIEVLTRDFGRFSLLAKGVRKARSGTIGLLRPFIPLSVSFSGRAELKSLVGVESTQPWSELKGLALYCGFYVNELVAHFLHRHDPHPTLFDSYLNCLSTLSAGEKLEASLRRFELQLLDHAGYGLPLAVECLDGTPIAPIKRYRFDLEAGASEAVDGEYSGQTLLALAAREFSDPGVLKEAKILLRAAIDAHLQGKSLHSRVVIQTLIKQSKHE